MHKLSFDRYAQMVSLYHAKYKATVNDMMRKKNGETMPQGGESDSYHDLKSKENTEKVDIHVNLSSIISRAKKEDSMAS